MVTASGHSSNVARSTVRQVKVSIGSVPIIGWVRTYERPWLARDVIAGLTVWGLIVPEGMAYASLAGLPPQAGLYTILVSLLAYAVFGTSRHLVVAATSATAALVGSSIAALKPADAAAYAGYAAALVLIVGVLFVLAGLAKLGFVAQFLSRPVTEGFVFGLAIFVAVGQLNKLFGVSKGSGNTFEKLWHVITNLGDANWWAFAIGALAIVALFGLPRLSKRLPSGLLVLGGAIALSTVMGLADNHDVEVVGTLPKGLPSLSLPDVGLSSLWILLPAAAGIVLVAYSEALGIAESFATRHGYEVDPNQELIAYGAANLASGMFGGLVACGGMSSTAVNDGGGAKTQLSGLTAAVAAVITIVALTPLFKNLPEAVLGALIIHAVSHMMSVAKLKAVYRVSPVEFWLGITALLGVVALDVLQGLLIAMAASLLLVIYNSSRSSVTTLGELPGRPGTFGAIERNPDAVSRPGILILRLDSALYYANAASNRQAFKDAIATAEPPVHTVIFSPEVQHQLDVTSVEMFTELVGWMRERGIDIWLTHVHADLLAESDRIGLLELVGADHILADIPAVLERIEP
jgi:sulfate permease, SulP family